MSAETTQEAIARLFPPDVLANLRNPLRPNPGRLDRARDDDASCACEESP